MNKRLILIINNQDTQHYKLYSYKYLEFKDMHLVKVSLKYDPIKYGKILATPTV